MSKQSKERRANARNPTDPEREPIGFTAPEYIPCIVVGGVANGFYLEKVETGAEMIELSRPTHLKPLESPGQAQPEAAKESDHYHVQAFVVPDQTGTPRPIGIAYVEGSNLAWAMMRIIRGFAEQSLRELREDNQRQTIQ